LKDKKQLMKQLNVNWGWTWNTFANKTGLKKGANAQLWLRQVLWTTRTITESLWPSIKVRVQ
jgi:hypothetical protein